MEIPSSNSQAARAAVRIVERPDPADAAPAEQPDAETQVYIDPELLAALRAMPAGRLGATGLVGGVPIGGFAGVTGGLGYGYVTGTWLGASLPDLARQQGKAPETVSQTGTSGMMALRKAKLELAGTGLDFLGKADRDFGLLGTHGGTVVQVGSIVLSGAKFANAVEQDGGITMKTAIRGTAFFSDVVELLGYVEPRLAGVAQVAGYVGLGLKAVDGVMTLSDAYGRPRPVEARIDLRPDAAAGEAS